MDRIRYKDFPQALKNRVDEIRKQQNKPLNAYPEEILSNLFVWRITEEGHTYWSNLARKNDFSEFEKPLEDKVIKSVSRNGIRTITSVEDKDGSIYTIGDRIKIFEKTSSNYGKIFEIIGFRWNKNNTHICAVTKVHSYGIRLDWIEHYVKPKKEPEFILPEKWCIKNNNQIIGDFFNNVISSLTTYNLNGQHNNKYLHSINIRNENVMNLKTEFASFSEKKPRENYTEITFEQFFTHVLFNGLKIGDKITDIFWNSKRTIIDLQYINNQSVIFYKYTDTNYSSPQCRMLLKNVKHEKI